MSTQEQNNQLDQDTLESIKKDLENRKKQIEEDLNDVAQKDDNEYKPKFPEFGDKPDENAQEISEYSTNIATEEVLEKSLRDINNALERIEKGTYGTCKYCGKTINAKRLQARPTASACIECKTKLQESS